MPSLRPAVQNEKHGRMMDQLEREGRRAIDVARASGQIVPVVVVNFNPVELTLPQGLTNWKVPREGHFGSPNEARPKTLAVHFNGKHYLPSYVVIKDAVLDKKPEPVRVEDGEPKTQYHPLVVPPIERAFEYYEAYNRANRSMMGGVLVFEGDRIDPLMQTSTDAKIRVPQKMALATGGSQLVFTETLLRHELKTVLDRQREYYERMYQDATTLHNDPQRRFGLPDERHRTWAQFGLDMGWRDLAPPWMERAMQEGLKRCPRCQLSAQNALAWFCVCGTPYDAFTAFMAGQDVAEVHLINLPDEQFEQVREESERRRQKSKLLKGGKN
jgi:hypothetical protein